MPGLFSYLSQYTSCFSSQVRVAFSISCNSKRLSNGRKMLLNGMRPTGGVCFLIVGFALVLLFKMQTLRDYSVGLVSGPSPPFAGRGGVGTSMYSPPNGKVFSKKELSLLLAEVAVNNNNNKIQ